MIDYARLFQPKQIAVIGASTNPEKLGGVVMNNLLNGNYSGKIIPVNPKGGNMFNLPVISSIALLPDNIDLTILALDAEMSVQAIREIGREQKKIPFAIIFAGGYGEIGNHDLEEQLKNACQETNIQVIGPNCMGLWNAFENLNASFMNILPPITGKISFVSQSGSLIAVAIYEKLRMGKFISIGNSITTSFEDILPFLEKDDNTAVIALYIESLQNGRKFLESIKNITKPVIAIRAGNSEAGQRSIASHTASLATNTALTTSLFKAHNIVQINSFETLSAVTRAFELMKLPKNNKILALSNAGGAICLFSDACAEYGLDTDPLPEFLMSKLKTIFPPQAPINNPLDLTVTGWQENIVRQVLDVLLEEKHNYGTIVYMPVVAPYQNAESDAKIAIEYYKKSKLPFMTCLLSGDKVRPIIPLLDASSIPYCTTIRETAEVLGHLSYWNKNRR
jgi:acyl-CoA synthetase (NDP forming)